MLSLDGFSLRSILLIVFGVGVASLRFRTSLSSSCVSLFARSLGVSEGELLWANAPEINSSVEIAATINKRISGYTFLQASPIRKVRFSSRPAPPFEPVVQ
jgi:hypothetical protein